MAKRQSLRESTAPFSITLLKTALAKAGVLDVIYLGEEQYAGQSPNRVFHQFALTTGQAFEVAVDGGRVIDNISILKKGQRFGEAGIFNVTFDGEPLDEIVKDVAKYIKNPAALSSLVESQDGGAIADIVQLLVNDYNVSNAEVRAGYGRNGVNTAIALRRHYGDSEALFEAWYNDPATVRVTVFDQQALTESETHDAGDEFFEDYAKNKKPFTLGELMTVVRGRVSFNQATIIKNIVTSNEDLFLKKGPKYYLPIENLDKVKQLIHNHRVETDKQLEVKKSAAKKTVTQNIKLDGGVSIDDSMKEVERIAFKHQIEDMQELVRHVHHGATNLLVIAGDGGVGKSYNVEQTLQQVGREPDEGYLMVAGSISTAGLYRTMFECRSADKILVIDDADAAFANQDSRNLIKAATDTKPKRVLSWIKKASDLFDPKTSDGREKMDILDNGGGVFDKSDNPMYPNRFEFKSRIIAISNLPINKLDPDGAIRTRGPMIEIKPKKEELIEYLAELAPNIVAKMANKVSEQRLKLVVDAISNSNRSDMSIRTLVRSLNMAAAMVNDTDANLLKMISRYA